MLSDLCNSIPPASRFAYGILTGFAVWAILNLIARWLHHGKAQTPVVPVCKFNNEDCHLEYAICKRSGLCMVHCACHCKCTGRHTP